MLELEKLGDSVCRMEVLVRKLTAWSTNLDWFTTRHGLGARLTHTFLPTEGHFVSNGERLPVREMRETFNTFTEWFPVLGTCDAKLLSKLFCWPARVPAKFKCCYQGSDQTTIKKIIFGGTHQAVSAQNFLSIESFLS